MLGDYYTNQMLSGAASTSMLGNVIDGQFQTPGLQEQGAALSLLFLLVLLIPMIYYVSRRTGPRRRPSRPGRLKRQIILNGCAA